MSERRVGTGKRGLCQSKVSGRERRYSKRGCEVDMIWTRRVKGVEVLKNTGDGGRLVGDVTALETPSGGGFVAGTTTINTWRKVERRG